MVWHIHASASRNVYPMHVGTASSFVTWLYFTTENIKRSEEALPALHIIQLESATSAMLDERRRQSLSFPLKGQSQDFRLAGLIFNASKYSTGCRNKNHVCTATFYVREKEKCLFVCTEQIVKTQEFITDVYRRQEGLRQTEAENGNQTPDQRPLALLFCYLNNRDGSPHQNKLRKEKGNL